MNYRIVIVTRFIDKIKKSQNIHQNIYNNFALYASIRNTWTSI